MGKLDFFEVGQDEFGSLDEFAGHITDEVDIGQIDGKLSIIGSVANFNSKRQFMNSLDDQFEILRDLDQVLLMNGEGGVPIYIHINDMCPIFITTGTKTKDQEQTINPYLDSEGRISRLRVGKKQMEEIRKSIVQDFPSVLIPYFTAHHSANADPQDDELSRQEITRSEFERTIQYYGKDGRKAFKELKNKYGVYPTNVQFEAPEQFKFRITSNGTFTINSGDLSNPLRLIQDSIERLKDVRGAIEKSDYSEELTNEYTGSTLTKSEPWEIRIKSGLSEQKVRNFHVSLDSRDWHFHPTRWDPSYDDQVGFRSEIADKISFGKTAVRTDGDTLRVFPRENTTFSQMMRLYTFSNDHLETNRVAAVQ